VRSLSIIIKTIKKARRGGKKASHVVIPIPKESGLRPGDEVIVTVYSDGRILIERKEEEIVEDEILRIIREGVEAKGFEGEGYNDIIKKAYESWQ